MIKPTVTVSVLTYNSSKTVLETLESIKAQTYPKLNLQICDDCSTDNTIKLCKDWITKNKDRFAKTKIIVPEHNTGVAANANRSWDACETEWMKEIAGDDLLLQNCIDDNMDYVSHHPDSILVFSRAKVFGGSQERCIWHEKYIFDYSFFQMNPSQQYERIKNASCLPTASAFYNMYRIREIGLRHDERIPFLEDRPKWISAIRKGVKFHFLDKYTVKYRLSKESLSNVAIHSPKFYESKRFAFFYYVFQDMYEKDPESAIKEAVKVETELYSDYTKCLKERNLYYKISIFRAINALKKVVKIFIKKQ